MELIKELTWRGMIHDIMPGTEEQLTKEITSAYVGFDPTADSLHIGNLVPVMLLKFLQLSGHKPIALVGGAIITIGLRILTYSILFVIQESILLLVI